MRIDEIEALNSEWYVLIWNGRGWNWSDAMSGEAAQTEYNRQLRLMPNAPARLVTVSTVAQEPGQHPEALNTPSYG